MMWILNYALFFTICINFCSGLSIYTKYGSTSVKFGYVLQFYLHSSSEMHCFFEDVAKDATLKATLTAIDNNQHEVHMRVTSPSGEYSEWKHALSSVNHEMTVSESGIYEVCTTARVGFHKLRMNLQLLTYVATDIEKVALERHKDRTTQEAVEDRINALVTKIYQIIFLQKHQSIGTKRDEIMQESNEKFVTYFSLIQICVIIVVGAFQTIAIRRFFNIDEKRARI
jgi:hypothetical protein